METNLENITGYMRGDRRVLMAKKINEIIANVK